MSLPEPSIVGNKAPIFVEHGDRIEVTWPLGRGLFWTTPDAVEGWAAQVNELRAERDQLKARLASGPCCDLHNTHCEPPGDLCCRQCTEAAHPHHPHGVPCVLTPELHPTRRDLDRMEGP